MILITKTQLPPPGPAALAAALDRIQELHVSLATANSLLADAVGRADRAEARLAWLAQRATAAPEAAK